MWHMEKKSLQRHWKEAVYFVGTQEKLEAETGKLGRHPSQISERDERSFYAGDICCREQHRDFGIMEKKSFPISMLENVCKGTVGEGCVQTWQLKTKTGEGVGAESSVHVPFQTGLHKPQFQSCFPCLGTANKWITFFIICCSSECFPNVLLAMQL